jgi:hypothetical protein
MTVPYTFGTESSPIPLSQLDANFAAPIAFANTAGNVANAAQPNITSVGTLTSLSVTGNVNSGNVRTVGSVSATGNITVGNVATGGAVSAAGNVTGGNLLTSGSISATGNATVGNITVAGVLGLGSAASITGNVNAGGNITAVGNISAQGNVLAQGIVSATGNIVTAGKFVGNFQGNIVGNITGAPGSSTQILFNTAGNVDAVGGLTYNKGSNALVVLGTISAQGNVTVGGNLSVASNVVVTGTSQLVGLVTAPTAITSAANNQVATTAFVSNKITAFQANNLGTISSQNASNVSITGGVIGGMTSVGLSGGWSITPNGNTLYFGFGGSNVAKLDSAGNFTTIGNITGSGTV